MLLYIVLQLGLLGGDLGLILARNGKAVLSDDANRVPVQSGSKGRIDRGPRDDLRPSKPEVGTVPKRHVQPPMPKPRFAPRQALGFVSFRIFARILDFLKDYNRFVAKVEGLSHTPQDRSREFGGSSRALAPDRTSRPRPARHVQRDFPSDRDVFRAVLLSVSRALLVEADIGNLSNQLSNRQCARTAAATASEPIATDEMKQCRNVVFALFLSNSASTMPNMARSGIGALPGVTATGTDSSDARAHRVTADLDPAVWS
jgi:hypothetical protein